MAKNTSLADGLEGRLSVLSWNAVSTQNTGDDFFTKIGS
jgi:hypothetical protein